MKSSEKKLDRRKFLGYSSMVLGAGIGTNIINPVEVFSHTPGKNSPRKPPSRYLKYHDKLDHCFSAVLQDVMDGMGYRNQCMDPAIRPLQPAMKTWGEAITIYVEAVSKEPEHPFQKEMELIDSANEGHLLVAQCNAPLSAFWGGLLSNAAIGRKISGVIIDGGARDYHEITELGFPTFCRGLSPYDSLGRMDGKEYDIPVECGNIRVNPGDLVFGDVDGVVVVPQPIVDEVIDKAYQKIQGESKVREELRSGAGVEATFKKYGIL